MSPEPDFHKFILPSYERYCCPSLNELKFISEKQTISLVLGSCISTVLVGRGESFILGANHIVLADPPKESIVATKSALQQIEEMLLTFDRVYKIAPENIICIHLVGGGQKKDKSFNINEKNIEAAKEILEKKNILTVFNDTGSYFVSNYSIQQDNLSIFVENKFNNEHISFIVDLPSMFNLDAEILPRLPVSSIERTGEFEYLIDEDVITFITGKRNR